MLGAGSKVDGLSHCRRAAWLLLALPVLPVSAMDAGLNDETATPEATAESARDHSEISQVVYVYGSRETYRESKSHSATRTPTPLEELPQSVFVITRDVIDDQAMLGLGDLVRYVPGVSMGQGEGHRDAPVFRGNLTTSDFFVDGMRDDLQYLRDLYNVERVDVLKGPSALVFGRGTGGGALNRVMKPADGERVRALDLMVGMYGQSRIAMDVGDTLGARSGARLNVVVEETDGFRDAMHLSRRGISPAWRTEFSNGTRLELFGEYFEDQRTVDRGVPAESGRPWMGSTTQFFGNPALSESTIEVRSGRGVLTHALTDDVTLRATVSYGDYEKYYSNVYPGGSVDSLGQRSQISAYQSATQRTNLLGQWDLLWQSNWGGQEQTTLLGFETGRQQSRNLRINASSAIFSLLDRGQTFNPDFSNVPALNNFNDLDTVAILLQNQWSLTPTIHLVTGLRWDHFDLIFDDLRAGSVDYDREDEFVSPKAGLVWEALPGLSLYGAWGEAYLPQSGEQFNVLDFSRAALQPEKFENYEIGLRWQPSSAWLLSAAVYQLDRTNTRAPGEVAGVTVLTGSQRAQGLEMGLQGELRSGWHMIGAMAWQTSKITRNTEAAPSGRESPLVPRFSASLWSRVAIAPQFDVALGVIHQDEQFASITNDVVLPRYTRLDAALFYDVSEYLKLQLNVENLTDEAYWFTAHNDNNITPGSGVLARLTLSSRF